MLEHDGARIKSRKILIGTLIFFLIALIGSFLTWFSFYGNTSLGFIDESMHHANGWDGYLETPIRVPNWLILLNLLFFQLAICLKNFKVWDVSLNWFAPVHVLAFLYSIVLIVGSFFSKDLSFGPGFYLFFISLVGSILLSSNLEKYK